MLVFKELRMLLVFLGISLALGGCGTTGGSFSNSRVGPGGIGLSYTKYGTVQVRASKSLAVRSNTLRQVIGRTLGGVSKKRGAAAILVYPRAESFPLGTIFEEPESEGFSVRFDPSLAADYSGKTTRVNVESAVFSGFMDRKSLKMLFLPRERQKLKEAFADTETPVTQIGTKVYLKDATVEILLPGITRNIGRRILKSASVSDDAHFFVADIVIRAREISYFLGPASFKGNPLNKNPESGFDAGKFKMAEARLKNISDVNGIKVITRKFDQKKIIAVGYSTLPYLTERGDDLIRMPFLPFLGDTYYVQSEKATILQARDKEQDEEVEPQREDQPMNLPIGF